jgi:hypothetical protein
MLASVPRSTRLASHPRGLAASRRASSAPSASWPRENARSHSRRWQRTGSGRQAGTLNCRVTRWLRLPSAKSAYSAASRLADKPWPTCRPCHKRTRGGRWRGGGQDGRISSGDEKGAADYPLVGAGGPGHGPSGSGPMTLAGQRNPPSRRDRWFGESLRWLASGQEPPPELSQRETGAARSADARLRDAPVAPTDTGPSTPGRVGGPSSLSDLGPASRRSRGYNGVVLQEGWRRWASST